MGKILPFKGLNNRGQRNIPLCAPGGVSSSSFEGKKEEKKGPEVARDRGAQHEREGEEAMRGDSSSSNDRRVS